MICKAYLWLSDLARCHRATWKLPYVTNGIGLDIPKTLWCQISTRQAFAWRMGCRPFFIVARSRTCCFCVQFTLHSSHVLKWNFICIITWVWLDIDSQDRSIRMSKRNEHPCVPRLVTKVAKHSLPDLLWTWLSLTKEHANCSCCFCSSFIISPLIRCKQHAQLR